MEDNKYPCISLQHCPYLEHKTADSCSEMKKQFEQIANSYREQIQQMAQLQQEMNQSRASIVKLGNELEGKKTKPFIKDLCNLLQTFKKNAKEDSKVQILCEQIDELLEDQLNVTTFSPIHGEKINLDESYPENNSADSNYIERTLACGYKDQDNKVITRAIVRLKEIKIEEVKEVRIYDFNKFR